MKEKFKVSEVSQIKVRKNVGYYQITGKGGIEDSMRFMFVKKPNLINRFFCKILLGWIWGDEK